MSSQSPVTALFNVRCKEYVNLCRKTRKLSLWVFSNTVPAERLNEEIFNYAQREKGSEYYCALCVQIKNYSYNI